MNKLTINELNKILDEYNINEADIVGTGKNGRIVKIDIVNAIESYLTKNDIYDPRHSPKPVVKPKSKTAGLKKGDLILYHDDDGLEFKAIVENVTATIDLFFIGIVILRKDFKAFEFISNKN